MEFTYNPDTPTQGILWYLYKNNEDIPYLNAVFTNASSHKESFNPEYAIDFNDEKYWHSEPNKPGEYITITTFYRIKLKGYLIKSYRGGPNSCHPRYWSFATSADGIHYLKNISYEDVDGHMNVKSSYQYVSYSSKKVQYFRIYVTGLSYCNQYHFDLNQVELLGTLYK